MKCTCIHVILSFALLKVVYILRLRIESLLGKSLWKTTEKESMRIHHYYIPYCRISHASPDCRLAC